MMVYIIVLAVGLVMSSYSMQDNNQNNLVLISINDTFCETKKNLMKNIFENRVALLTQYAESLSSHERNQAIFWRYYAIWLMRKASWPSMNGLEGSEFDVFAQRLSNLPMAPAHLARGVALSQCNPHRLYTGRLCNKDDEPLIFLSVFIDLIKEFNSHLNLDFLVRESSQEMVCSDLFLLSLMTKYTQGEPLDTREKSSLSGLYFEFCRQTYRSDNDPVWRLFEQAHYMRPFLNPLIEDNREPEIVSSPDFQVSDSPVLDICQDA